MVVRMRHTRSQRDQRRAHHALEARALTTPKDGGVPHLRHRVSLDTGMYRGITIIDKVEAVARKSKKSAPKETK
jgi:ribosomal protein L32